MTPDHQDVTKMVRVTLPADRWRELRLEAAEQDVSLTRLVGSILGGAVTGRGREDSVSAAAATGPVTPEGTV
jgi:hypothetical protein